MAANYVLLERIELNDSAASVTFSSIPQSGYTDLKVVVSARGTVSATNDYFLLKINNDNTSSRYTTRSLYGNGASAASAVSGYNSFAYLGVIDAASATSSTFANHELYIPNYTASTQKSYSVDGVQENNATTAFAYMLAGLYNQTTAISSLVFLTASGNFAANSTFSLYGLAAVGTTPVIAPKASGGNITTDGTYWIHTFNTTGAFVPSQALTCDTLVVAGGGGGGNDIGGGGGAGGFRTSTGLSAAVQSYTITVGAGGAGGSGGANGVNGNTSTFSTISSSGGGGGGAYTLNGSSGGSGGGGGSASGASGQKLGGSGNSGSYSPVEGYAGGNGYSSPSLYGAGGGGGASAVGSVGTSGTGGAGGAGTANSYSGSSVTYSTGGTGWGGTGAGSPTDATANTGNGGMGGKANSLGGAGGSGIVIIRYPIA